MNSLDYLEEVKKRKGITSDYQLAHILGMSRQVISKYRTRGTKFDDYTVFKVAEILKIEKGEIIANINIATEKRKKRLDFWINQATKYSSFLFLMPIWTATVNTEELGSTNQSSIKNADSVYYVKYKIGIISQAIRFFIQSVNQFSIYSGHKRALLRPVLSY